MNFKLSFLMYRTSNGRVYRMHSNSHQKCSVKNAVLKNFANFTGKHLSCSHFVIKLREKRLQHRCFPPKFVKFIEHFPILKNICERLLLYKLTHYLQLLSFIITWTHEKSRGFTGPIDNNLSSWKPNPCLVGVLVFLIHWDIRS